MLLALGVAVTLMFVHTVRDRSGDGVPSTAGGADVEAELSELVPSVTPSDREQGFIVRGIVLTPDGRPAASAAVTLYRLLSAWPEWRRERVDEAITRDDGRFQFRAPTSYGHVVEVGLAGYAGRIQEVSPFGEELRMQLQPAFSLSGFVRNDLGAPVPNARVSIESVPREHRRARTAMTAADGSYRFEDLAAGPARVVVHHESWQPTGASGIVIGDQPRATFRFERPTMAPLRGRVVGTTTQQPIAGAVVELLPINRLAGLAAPIATTTDVDGTFLLGGLPRGSMRLLVRHPEHGSYLHTQSIGAAAHDLLVELPPRTVVRGELYAAGDEDDDFFAGTVLEFEDEIGELHWAAVGDDGAFAFPRPLSPGIAKLRALRGAFVFRNTQTAELVLRIDEDTENVLEIPVLPPAVVRGRFVDDDGRPLAGVRTVRTQLLSESVRFLSDAAWQLDAAALTGGLVRLFDVDRDELLAVSDDDGRFEVRGFAPGPLLARAACPGCGSRWLRLVMPKLGEVSDVGDVVLPPGCQISGRVLRGSKPFVGAMVTVVSRDCQSMAITDADGVYHITDLVPGEYDVEGRITGRPTGSSVRQVTVAADQPARHVEIVLELGRTVRGYVHNQEGRPLADVLVAVRGRAAQVTASNGSGRFEIELPRRAVELVVTVGDRSMQKVVPVRADQREIEIEVETPPTSSIQARVFGLPGRHRLPGVLLRLTPLSPGAASIARWVETADGVLRWAQAPCGPVQVEIWCEGHAPFARELELVPDEEHDLGEIVLEPGARLRGVVRDDQGRPLRDALVLLGEETDSDLFTPSVRTAADGSFTIRGVSSRSRHLVVRHPGFAACTRELQLPRDVLSAEPIAITLERGATIEVLVADDAIPDDGVVQLRRGGAVLATAVLDDRGRAWFANRSAGTYEVMLADGDLPDRRVEVKPGDTVVRVRFANGHK
ncbi:MAG TPA: hypothetical protein ENI87_15535 [bacterium]|nr:hypothetical protein [bacterium]